jgi:flagellar basal-body rod protein FlgC
MSLAQILDISAAGMDVQQVRLQAAAANIANARTTAPAGSVGYQPLEVVVRAGAPIGMAGAAMPFPIAETVTAANVSPKRVYDPGHPDADKDGFISLPGIDPIGSMLDLLEISKGYEANLRAFDITRSLIQRSIDIGSHQ